LAELRDLHPGEDIRRIEAARLHRQGETEKAIKILNQIRTPEAKAQLFGYLYLQKGPKVALEWIGSGLSSLDFMPDWGWENVALAMAELGRWHDAIDLLARYRSENREIAVGIPFLEGMLHIALAFAEEHRLRVIRGDIFPVKAGLIDGPEVPAHRQRALECFEMVERLAQQYEVKPRERRVQFWKAWLLLTDKTTEKEGIEFVQCQLESTDPDPGLLDLAVRFKVQFDSSSIQEFLKRRELTGTLDADDLFIKLTLLQHQKATKRIIDFLKREKNGLIDSVLSRAV
jgi:tetratricopeptide (TPR) repeat protein